MLALHTMFIPHSKPNVVGLLVPKECLDVSCVFSSVSRTLVPLVPLKLTLDLFPHRAMSSAATTSPSVDKVDGFSRKSVRKAKQKRSQSSSQFRSQGKPIELTPLPLLTGKSDL